MSPDKKVTDMSFGDFLAVARKHLDDAERTYAQIVVSADSRDDLVNSMADASYAIAMGSSKGLADAVALSRAARGEFDPAELDDSDLWDAVAADVQAGLSDMGTLHEAAGLSLGEATAADEGRQGAWQAASHPDRHEDWHAPKGGDK